MNERTYETLSTQASAHEGHMIYVGTSKQATEGAQP